MIASPCASSELKRQVSSEKQFSILDTAPNPVLLAVTSDLDRTVAAAGTLGLRCFLQQLLRLAANWIENLEVSTIKQSSA
jgi:hypothetical protein